MITLLKRVNFEISNQQIFWYIFSTLYLVYKFPLPARLVDLNVIEAADLPDLDSVSQSPQKPRFFRSIQDQRRSQLMLSQMRRPNKAEFALELAPPHIRLYKFDSFIFADLVASRTAVLELA